MSRKQSRSPARRQIPQWVVTAPQRTATLVGGVQPWGVYHARQIDDRLTACGTLPLNWHAFWHLRFVTGDPQACADCARAVARSAAAAPSDRSLTAS